MTRPPDVVAGGGTGRAGHRRGIGVAAVLTAMMLVVLDAAMINVALPTIGRSLQVSPAMAVRVITAYQLGLLMGLLPAGALGERLGCRRVFTAGVVLFTCASVLCAVSPSLWWLLGARFIQGVGGAGIMALGVALLRFTVEEHRLGTAIGWNAMTVALSSAAGPTIGAAILFLAPWPWLFVLNIPVGMGALLASRALPRVERSGVPVDARGIALNVTVFALLAVSFVSATAHRYFALAAVAAAVILVIGLVRHVAGRPAPLIPLDLLSRASFRVSVLASVLCFAGQTAALVALPFHLQQAYGLTVWITGLYMLPWPLAVAVAGPLAGKLAMRVRTAWLSATGGLLLSMGMATAALLPADAKPQALIACTILCGLGFGLFNIPNNRNMFLSAPHERGGAAGAMQGMARLIGQAAGAASITLLFVDGGDATAPRLGLIVGAVLASLAALASLMNKADGCPERAI